jgi:hypothetical protein
LTNPNGSGCSCRVVALDDDHRIGVIGQDPRRHETGNAPADDDRGTEENGGIRRRARITEPVK